MIQKLYLKAKKDFKIMIEKATEQQIQDGLKGYGISAAKFAMQYITPQEDSETYKKIYNIYFNFFLDFECLQKNFKIKEFKI